ncbi:hypothetical protein L249_4567 [Ophiocordyceps polyrhachis-furcata BCC 54312]|uniref:LysM domain-containing protein n=1 Tax=Ophiocordyceps polyrhachis-furcata BCC 54312 TaxID=1330021 RepID=A0A367KZ56_9HYPO|nr:hypothetical protein L249_4567 [Ophiocordyceps polyrhachis-furcata BCC 54312]
MAKAFLAHAILLGSSHAIASAIPPEFGNGRSVTHCAIWHEFTARNSDQLLKEISTTSEDFKRSNPDVELSGETLVSGRRYCLAEAKDLPLLELCKLKHRIRRGDTCKSVQKFYDLSFEDLYKWNPRIGEKCQFFHPGARVCVTEPTGVLNYGLSGLSE